MPSIVDINDLSKTYADGFSALNSINLQIEEGEILALLGPNGAGKTTLISTICGLSKPTFGQIQVHGFDVQKDYKSARKLIGLVPQEINLEPFTKVSASVAFTRGLFGMPKNETLIEAVLRDLSLWEKRNARVFELSGGMKRRLLIAKALCHEPRVLFLDEPTAGVDVELRRDMWDLVSKLRDSGVTIILTTHYIEEAEAIAERIGVINKGSFALVEPKHALMRRLGQKELAIELRTPMSEVPSNLAHYGLVLSQDRSSLTYSYDTKGDRTGITALLSDLQAAGVGLTDISTKQTSLEEIFVELVKETP